MIRYLIIVELLHPRMQGAAIVAAGVELAGVGVETVTRIGMLAAHENRCTILQRNAEDSALGLFFQLVADPFDEQSLR